MCSSDLCSATGTGILEPESTVPQCAGTAHANDAELAESQTTLAYPGPGVEPTTERVHLTDAAGEVPERNPCSEAQLRTF